MLFALGIFLFVMLVVIHELGHYFVAKRNDVDVEEFGLGFPPRLFAWKRKGDKTEYSVNLLPLGGFVSLKGENDADKRPHSYGASPLWVKTRILLAGIGMNILVAFVIFTGLALTGMPQLVDNQFQVANDASVIRPRENVGVVLASEVAPGSPAAEVGIIDGDEILTINEQTIDTPSQLAENTEALAGQTITVTWIHENQSQSGQVAINPTRVENEGYFGVRASLGETGVEVVRSTWSAPIVGIGTMAQFTQLNVEGIANTVADLFQGDTAAATEQVAGPVGVVKILQQSSTLGLAVILMFIAYISLTLALMNLLPIPALDGGKLFVTLLYKGLGKTLTKKAEQIIYGSSFAFLLILIVLISYVDIKRW